MGLVMQAEGGNHSNKTSKKHVTTRPPPPQACTRSLKNFLLTRSQFKSLFCSSSGVPCVLELATLAILGSAPRSLWVSPPCHRHLVFVAALAVPPPVCWACPSGQRFCVAAPPSARWASSVLLPGPTVCQLVPTAIVHPVCQLTLAFSLSLSLPLSLGLESIMPRRSKSSCRYSTQQHHHGGSITL